MYTLNLTYPADLRYLFEVLHKVFMELDASKFFNKVLALTSFFSELGLKFKHCQWIVEFLYGMLPL